MLEEPILVTIDSKEYKVEGFTGKLQGEFEKYMQHQMLIDLKSQRELIGENDYLALLERHLKRCKAGYMIFFSDDFFDFIGRQEEFNELLWRCLRVHTPTIDPMMVLKWVKEQPEEARELFRRLAETKKD